MYYLNFNDNSLIHHNKAGFAEINHVHIERTFSECELFLVVSGTIYIKQNNHEYELKENDYFLSLPNVKYGGYRVSNGKFYWAHFDFKDKDVIFNESKDGIYSLAQYGHLNDASKTIILFNLLEQYSMIQNEEMANILQKAILMDIAISLKSEPIILLKDQHFQTIVGYFRTSPYCNEFSNVKEMADFFGYNEKYMIRLFKSKIGQSPMQYFIDNKIKRAEEQLASTTKSVKQIAMDLNYDYYYFIRLFTKKVGISPLKYRKSVSPPYNK